MSSGGHKTSAIPRPKAGATRTRTHGVKPGSKPSKGPATKGPATKSASTTKSTSTRTKPPRATDKRDDSRFADFTRPIPVDKQLVRGRKRRVVGIGAAVITSAFIAALFVLPVQAWMRQQDDLDEKNAQLAALEDANVALENEVGQLQTPEGIEQAAREEIGYVQQGEVRKTMLPAPDAPLTLPSGWPYSTITQVVAVRTASAAKN